MLKLIPAVKKLELKEGKLETKGIFYSSLSVDKRVISALSKLPYDEKGAKLEIEVLGEDGEGYELSIQNNKIKIKAESDVAAFWAVQTLRQIFAHDQVPFLYINDKPDFKYRGFYHDVTRGKISTVETLKDIIDKMAYLKLNSFQLYVEHVFNFKEYADINEKTGYLTPEEIKEIDEYCEENFIEFIPSVSTFGHLYELLNQEKYKHLRVLKEELGPNFWLNRMRHHTINPLIDESFEVIKSIIDQYMPCFKSDTFNICCDETFDLKLFDEMGMDSGKIYVEFVNKIADYVKSRGKKVMMWADILLKHPETIESLPEDICFLNWDYKAQPVEENVAHFEKINRQQIVCPGISTWNRYCENIDTSEGNITLLSKYGYEHGAIGVLNTNWGDWGNPCFLELSMFGLALGAEKSWTVEAKDAPHFYDRVNFIIYENENGVKYLKELCDIHKFIGWKSFVTNYFEYRYGKITEFAPALNGDINLLKEAYESFTEKLSKEKWKNDEYRQAMLISAEGLCLLGEFAARMMGQDVTRTIDTEAWLKKYRENWLKGNKESELRNLEEVFRYCDKI
ncbi:MAG: hypothetical protein E7582_05025 [Ruminococcaceae bacterium]|nr:hypothetical protein [Oscillospiraceae bacterium]